MSQLQEQHSPDHSPSQELPVPASSSRSACSTTNTHTYVSEASNSLNGSPWMPGHLASPKCKVLAFFKEVPYSHETALPLKKHSSLVSNILHITFFNSMVNLHETTQDLIDHLNSCHGLSLKVEEKTFNNWEEFMKWKETEEKMGKRLVRETMR